MNKYIVYLFFGIYVFASSTLAHSFCIEELPIVDTMEESHDCCDGEESHENCYDTCLGDEMITVKPCYYKDISKYDLLPASPKVLEPVGASIPFSVCDLPNRLQPWLESYIGVTKKTE